MQSTVFAAVAAAAAAAREGGLHTAAAGDNLDGATSHCSLRLMPLRENSAAFSILNLNESIILLSDRGQKPYNHVP